MGSKVATAPVVEEAVVVEETPKPKTINTKQY
jgi:hypothetical protein